MLPKGLFKDGFATKKNPTGEPINIGPLKDIREFIRNNFKNRQSINFRTTSYELKHIAEDNIKSHKGYVSNGDLIASMILEGYQYKEYPENSSNACFNITQNSIKPFVKE